jgi:hypothetical protein
MLSGKWLVGNSVNLPLYFGVSRSSLAPTKTGRKQMASPTKTLEETEKLRQLYLSTLNDSAISPGTFHSVLA